jgi:hypothetical protein
VAVFPRLASTRRDRVVSRARWAVRTLAAFGATAAFLLFPSAAGALVTEVEGTKAGVTPRNASSMEVGLLSVFAEGEIEKTLFNPAPESFANKVGHPVVHGAQVSVIYWDPNDLYHGDWQSIIDTFMHNVNAATGGGGHVFAVDTQYSDTTNKPASGGFTYRGTYIDDAKYPESGCEDARPLYEQKASKVTAVACLTDAQVRAELQNFIALHSLPKGMNDIFYVLTPPAVTVCLDGGGVGGHCSDYAASLAEQKAEKYESESYENSFCSYHADINPGGLETGDANTILYSVIPWTAGGVGDGQLSAADQTEAYACQDGGFDASSKPSVGKHELLAKMSAEEETAYAALATPFEKEAFLRAREPGGPHVQEPNQAPCPTRDGYCDQGLADIITNQIASEEHNTVTDPLLNSWKDESQHEASDECRNWFAPISSGSSSPVEGTGAGSLSNQSIAGGNYYLNTAFNRAGQLLKYPGVECVTGLRLEPKFTATSPVNVEETIAFDGMESTVTLGANSLFNEKAEEKPNYANYTWTFGDGSPAVSGYAPGAPVCEAPWLSPCAGSVFHSYKYGGTYEVTLTVTDVGGFVARTSQLISVIGPPPPASTGPGSGSGAGGSSTTGGSTSGGSTSGGSTSGGSAASVPTPTVSELVLSKGLRKALRKGLSVRYSVSEQVAGRFELLLATSLARRLHLSGVRATGLAAGAPPETVIGKAILVTTHGGVGTLTIQFGSNTVKRLRHMHSVTLIVRLLVHNAHAKTATATATVTLAG